MDNLGKMAAAKTRFYDAAAALFDFKNDEELRRHFEGEVVPRSEEYLQILIDLSQDPTQRRAYREACAKTANRLRPFIFELRLVFDYRRQG